MLKVKMSKNPYADEDDRRVLYTKPNFVFEPGITVLVGRNGSGKTTLLNGIKDYCKKENIPCYHYDNYEHGGQQAKSKYGYFGDYKSLFSVLFHSEGEQIYENFCNQVKQIGSFCKQHKTAPKLVFCLDALDSGLDCDGIKQILDCFNLIINDNKDKEVYIIASANNYGLIRNQRCLDVKTNIINKFITYEQFENFIMKRYEEDRAEQ